MRSLIFLLLLSFNASAALYDRGSGLIYDDVLDITWLQDANYASTIGYSNHFTNQWYNSSAHSGGMYWSDAVVFVDQLDYAGFNHWRLPSIKSSGEGYNQYNSELGHMFYNNLNNDCPLSCSSVNSAFTDASTNLEKNFFNLVGNQHEGSNGGLYWFSEELDENPIRAWAFWTHSKYQSSDHKESYDFIWPVHDGDIGLAPVPLPAGIYLFLSGLVGLGLIRGRNG